jgi:hypothetical protein
MNNTPETTEATETKETKSVVYIPVDNLPLCHLTEREEERAYNGRPNSHNNQNAIPYLLFETKFRIPVSEKDAWPEDLAEAESAPTLRTRGRLSVSMSG